MSYYLIEKLKEILRKNPPPVDTTLKKLTVEAEIEPIKNPEPKKAIDDERPPKEWMDYCEKEIVPKVIPKVKDTGAFCGHIWYYQLTEETKAEYEKLRKEREAKEKEEKKE